MRKIGINIALATALVGAAFAQTQQQTQPTTDQSQPQNSQQQPYPNTTQQTYPSNTQQTTPTTDQSQQQTYPNNTQQQYPNNTQQSQPQVQPRTQQQADQQQQQVVNSTNPGEIPAGTDLYIRADQDIKAQTADPQRTYPGTITRQIVTSDGRVLVPRGTPVQLAVMDTSGTGNNKSMQLGVTSMNINGNTYNVISNAASSTSNSSAVGGDQGIGANKRTATHVGGGAVLGTVLGAVIGGGKGAAIGAVTGAAAGGAVQVLTKGNKINVPAETEMQFHLDQPIRLQGYNGSNY